MYSASSYLFDVGYHAAAVAVYHETPEPITKAITALLEILLSLQVALVGRHEGIALITKDPSKAALVDLALEGSPADLPPPSVSTLATLSKQFAELEVKQFQANFEQAGRRGGRGSRGGRGHSGRTPPHDSAPSSSTQ